MARQELAIMDADPGARGAVDVMRRWIRQHLTIVLAGSNVLASGSTLVVLAVASRYLPAASVGTFVLVVTWQTIFGQIADGGTSFLLVRATSLGRPLRLLLAERVAGLAGASVLMMFVLRWTAPELQFGELVAAEGLLLSSAAYTLVQSRLQGLDSLGQVLVAAVNAGSFIAVASLIGLHVVGDIRGILVGESLGLGAAALVGLGICLRSSMRSQTGGDAPKGTWAARLTVWSTTAIGNADLAIGGVFLAREDLATYGIAQRAAFGIGIVSVSLFQATFRGQGAHTTRRAMGGPSPWPLALLAWSGGFVLLRLANPQDSVLALVVFAILSVACGISMAVVRHTAALWAGRTQRGLMTANLIQLIVIASSATAAGFANSTIGLALAVLLSRVCYAVVVIRATPKD